MTGPFVTLNGPEAAVDSIGARWNDWVCLFRANPACTASGVNLPHGKVMEAANSAKEIRRSVAERYGDRLLRACQLSIPLFAFTTIDFLYPPRGIVISLAIAGFSKTPVRQSP